MPYRMWQERAQTALEDGDGMCAAYFHETQAAPLQCSIKALQELSTELRALKSCVQLHGVYPSG